MGIGADACYGYVRDGAKGVPQDEDNQGRGGHGARPWVVKLPGVARQVRQDWGS
jgi:hypothetical protein